MITQAINGAIYKCAFSAFSSSYVVYLSFIAFFIYDVIALGVFESFWRG